MNDGSTASYDRYFDEVKNAGYKVLSHEVNKGKGAALKTAFNHCLKNYPSFIGCVTADSDGQHSVKDILRCIEELRTHRDELILGCRDFHRDDVPFNSRFGNNITKWVFKAFCGLKISDTQTGLRGIPSSFMEELLNLPGNRFEFETQMLIVSKNRIPIREITIDTIYDSKTDHATHFHPIKDSFRIYKIIFFKKHWMPKC